MVKTKRSRFMLTSLCSFSTGFSSGEILNYYKNQMLHSGDYRFFLLMNRNTQKGYR
jgi:hypothetical protein